MNTVRALIILLGACALGIGVCLLVLWLLKRLWG